jgi:putative transposase
MPVHIVLTEGQRHEAKVAPALLEHAQGAAFLGDAAYDSDEFRLKLAAKNIEAVIPPCGPRKVAHPYDRDLYKERHLVEIFFNRIKQFRRVATRYEKLARNYLSVVMVACIKMWLF